MMNKIVLPAVSSAVLTVCLLAAAPPMPAAAQSNWVSGWAGAFMDPGNVTDDESDTVWNLGTSLAAGIGVQHLFGSSLILGAEVGYAPLRHEVRDQANPDVVLADGTAQLLTTMVTGRLGGGGGDFFTYLTGGIGAVTYGIPHLERWDTDFSFRVGAGLEYRITDDIPIFLEWNRWRAMHQNEGVDDNTVRHSSLQLGARYGF